LTHAVCFQAVTCLRLLLLSAVALFGLREVSAGAARFKGFPSRQQLVIIAVPTPSEPVVKLPPPIAPGTDKTQTSIHNVGSGAGATVTIENNLPAPAATKSSEETSRTDAEAARKAKIKAERERLNHNALVWQQERAAAGSATAKRSLAMRYLTGDGVEKDEVKGMDLLREGAAGGDSAAIKELAKREPAKKE
jgi:hypothetical protein